MIRVWLIGFFSFSVHVSHSIHSFLFRTGSARCRSSPRESFEMLKAGLLKIYMYFTSL